MILEKLIGHCCDQETVAAANAELETLRTAAREREELRTVATAVLMEIGAAGLADELDTVKLLRGVLRATAPRTPQATDVEKGK